MELGDIALSGGNKIPHKDIETRSKHPNKKLSLYKRFWSVCSSNDSFAPQDIPYLGMDSSSGSTEECILVREESGFLALV